MCHSLYLRALLLYMILVNTQSINPNIHSLPIESNIAERVDEVGWDGVSVSIEKNVFTLGLRAPLVREGRVLALLLAQRTCNQATV